jgi:hypothetical protein
MRKLTIVLTEKDFAKLQKKAASEGADAGEKVKDLILDYIQYRCIGVDLARGPET